ncbi:MAG: PHB depolymerase family esterase [Betaproteobacteria bacterium]
MNHLAHSLARRRLAGALLFCLGGLGSAYANDSGNDVRTITQGAIVRSYVVRVPEGVSARGLSVPLVFVLHGGGGNAANAEAMTGFTQKARKEGFIVVYPEGTSRFGTRLLTWNAGHCCGYAMRKSIDDVAFIRALIDKLSAEYPVDAKRIYATGMSNGAMMSHRLGIGLSDRLAAIAPVVGALFGDEARPANPVSAIIFNGAVDQSVPPEGGPPGGRAAHAWDGKPTRPALEQAAFWARADGCETVPEKTEQSSHVLTRYRCPSTRDVELYLVKDNGHAWPGGQSGSARGDKPTSALNATDLIWAFFKAHPR